MTDAPTRPTKTDATPHIETAVLDKFRRLFLGLDQRHQLEFLKRLNPALLTTALEERRTVNLAGVAAESLGRGASGDGWFTPKDPQFRDKPIDVRASRRMSVQLPARVVYDEDRCSRDCLVTEISDWGCKIKVGGANELPDGFKLFDQSGKNKRSCRVVWRRLDEIGVEFVV